MFNKHLNEDIIITEEDNKERFKRDTGKALIVGGILVVFLVFLFVMFFTWFIVKDENTVTDVSKSDIINVLNESYGNKGFTITKMKTNNNFVIAKGTTSSDEDFDIIVNLGNPCIYRDNYYQYVSDLNMEDEYETLKSEIYSYDSLISVKGYSYACTDSTGDRDTAIRLLLSYDINTAEKGWRKVKDFCDNFDVAFSISINIGGESLQFSRDEFVDENYENFLEEWGITAPSDDDIALIESKLSLDENAAKDAWFTLNSVTKCKGIKSISVNKTSESRICFTVKYNNGKTYYAETKKTGFVDEVRKNNSKGEIIHQIIY